MPQPLQSEPLLFPLKGLHEGAGYDYQPEGTTSDAVNVCSYDVLRDRLRGGRRAGLSKLNPLQGPLNGTNPVQAVLYASRLVTATVGVVLDTLPPQVRPPFTDRYFLPQDFRTYAINLSGSAVASQIGPTSTSSATGTIPVDWVLGEARSTAALISTGAGIVRQVVTPTLQPLNSGTYVSEVRLTETSPVGVDADAAQFAFYSRATEDLKSHLRLQLAVTTDGAGGLTVTSASVFAVVNGSQTTIQTGLAGFAIPKGATVRFVEELDDGDSKRHVRVFVNGVKQLDFIPSDDAQWTAGMTTALTGKRVGFALDVNTVTVKNWTVSFPGVFAASTTDWVDRLLAVCGGSAYIVTRDRALLAGDGAGVLTDRLADPQLCQAFSRVFMVDGEHSVFFDLADDTVKSWADAVTNEGKGTFPGHCPLICLYRGRVVLAGKADEPYNWFMPRSGDPLDFDYAPATPDGLEAVAGNNSKAGLVGDRITALIPCGDDYLIFGCDHSIWRMAGDPAAGGSLEEVSNKTGIAFGRAWARDPQGTIYFWGVDGIYRMTATGTPENMTSGRIARRIRSVNLNTHRVLMEWDTIRDQLLVLILPRSGSGTFRVLKWERRADAWWEDSYPSTIGPTCLFAFDGRGDDDRTLIMGGLDGHLREIDEDAASDDGVDISSRVRYAPMIAPAHNAEVVLTEVLPVLAADSGAVNLQVYTGQTAEECVRSTTPRFVRALLREGRNAAVRQRVRGYAVQIALAHTGATRWAVEGLSARFAAGGRPRKEAKGGA